MTDAITWAALIGSLGSIATFIGYAVKSGRELQSAKDAAEGAKTSAVAAGAKADLAMAQLSEFRERAALHYASSDDLKSSERRIMDVLTDIKGDVRGLSDRLTNFLDSRSKS